MSALEALAQRIVVRAYVRGIARDELGGYLEHRLRLSGGELPLFERATVEAIHPSATAPCADDHANREVAPVAS